ncbi:cellulose binding domain-containing protein [Acrocarpospora sp. B8E8]|uniref:cellulose binding domain-containing protein n=1 Tax=Acrocarpospora sp. B8E8 TaxID=3153572 RepID=UPI00325EE644
MTVRAGNAPISAWTVRWAFAYGQTITQIWSGTATANGANIAVRNVSYNGSVPANGTTMFGFLGSWNGSANAVPTSVTCTSP